MPKQAVGNNIDDDLLKAASVSAQFMWQAREAIGGAARQQADTNPRDPITFKAMDQGTFAKTLILMLLDFHLEESYVSRRKEKQQDLLSEFLKNLIIYMSRRHKKKLKQDAVEDDFYYELQDKKLHDRIKKVYGIVEADIHENPLHLSLIAGKDSPQKSAIVDRVYNKLSNEDRDYLGSIAKQIAANFVDSKHFGH